MLGRILPSVGVLANGSMLSFVPSLKTFVGHTSMTSRILSAINPSPFILQIRMAGTYKLKSNSVLKDAIKFIHSDLQSYKLRFRKSQSSQSDYIKRVRDY